MRNKLFVLIPILFCILILSIHNTSAIDVYSCQAINAAGSYDLINNVVSNGTCIIINANNVNFNLNGYTITYANQSFQQIYNGDFEIPNPSDPSLPDGWDFSGAPQSRRTAGEFFERTVYNGTYAIHTTTPAADQIMISPQVLLTPGINYIASAMFDDRLIPSENYLGDITIEVINAGDSSVISTTSTAGDSNFGFQFSPRGMTSGIFTVSQPTQARIRIRLTGLTGSGTVRLDYVRLVMANVYGIDTGTVQNANITNGAIKQTTVDCLNCGLLRGSLQGAEISYLSGYMGGVEARVFQPMSAPGLGACYNARIHDNTFIHNNFYRTDGSDVVNRRDYQYAMIFCRGIGNFRIFNNRIWGSPQAAIRIENMNMGDTSEGERYVYNNDIRHNSKYTQGFGVQVGIEPNGVTNAEIFNNIINVTSGRGIHIEWYNTQGISVHNNQIWAREQRNQEYYNGITDPLGGSYGIQIEDGAHEVRVYNNYAEIKTHPNRGSGIGLRFTSNYGMGNNVEIFNNTFIGINVNPELGSSYYGRGISMHTAISNPTFKFYNNTIKSNNQIIEFDSPEQTATFESNTFEKLSNPINYVTTYFVGGLTNLTLLDTTVVNNASLDSVQFGGASIIRIRWFLDIVANDQNSAPLDAALVIRDKNNNLIYSGTTGPAGRSRQNLLEYTNSQGSKTYYSPFNVTVTYNSVVISRMVNLSTSKIEIFSFTTGCITWDTLIQAINEWNNGERDINSIVQIVKQWLANGC